MATPVAELVEEEAAVKSGEHGPTNRNRTVSGVSFKQRVSILSAVETEMEWDMMNSEEEASLVSAGRRQLQWWGSIVGSHYCKQFFRLVSVINLIVLIFCVPFYNLNGLDDTKRRVVTIQFITVTVVDFILSCIYTLHLIIRIGYYCKTKREEIKTSEQQGQLPLDHGGGGDEDNTSSMEYKYIFRNLTALFLLTASMWYTVGIGVYRSIDVTISMWWYVGYAPRAILAVFPALNLSLKVESAAVQKLLGFLKWKQLAMVTGFYFIFLFIFALMGVHIIGGLDHICMERTMDDDGNYSVVPAFPLTHCNPTDSTDENRQFYCALDMGNNTGLVCLMYPPFHNHKLFFDYRSFVYYGQYRVILDALFAVYEASTLELWSFMMYSAMDTYGSTIPVFFYFFLVVFVVVLLQQSIFLVVIIESFADLRDQSSFFWKKTSSSQKSQLKPKTVLTLEDPTTNKLQLRSLEYDTSPAFLNKYEKFLERFEKVFLVIVLLDAVITASKHSDMKYNEFKIFLQVWELLVSMLFVLEISFILFFHLYHGQWKLFFRRPYYICLIILAIGGLVASLPIDINGTFIYNPFKPATGLAIFQSLRFLRLLKFSQAILDFVLKISGKSIPILCVITLILICWLAVFNAQLFGYNVNYPEECSGIAEEHFGTFLESFQSTFQLVMNEAWTELVSEVMCRSNYWFVTNFYFIVIHLFSSLIFLNFFGAVILDNLEYDEEEKKAKLEEVKKKEAEYNESVSYRLKIFKKLGNEPKKLKPPPGIGGDDPKLDEVEIKKFFDSASTNDLLEDPHDLLLLSSHISKDSQPNVTRRPSYLNQLSLVTSSADDVDLVPTETATGPELHGIYQSITLLLHYISLWRKYNEQEQSKDPRSSNIHYLFGQSPYERKKANLNNRNVKSEYEIFREKHRFFDMALFCMTPEHKLRKFCTKLLTAQAEPLRYSPTANESICQMLLKKIHFIFKWFVSRMPYSTWIVFVGLGIIVSIQMLELSLEVYHMKHSYTPIVEGIYVLMMLSWLVLKVISHGLFLNPHAAISSVWDVLDWILVLDSALLLLLLPFWTNPDDRNFISIDIEIAYFPAFYKWLYVIRCLRPLHWISVLDSLRAVVREIVEGWKNLLKAAIVMLGFLFMFASLGVQLFAGTGDDNPLAFCNDPTQHSIKGCTGEFEMVIDVSREFLPLNSSTFPKTKMLVPRVWYTHARDFPFNNVVEAFITLFELLTLEGWPDVRDLFAGRNETANAYMSMYIHVFVFFAVNIGLQLFLGIVVNNFNEHKPGHTFLLTVEQNRWAELMQRVSLQRPDKLPRRPCNNPVRLKLYQFLTHSSFRLVPTIIIGLSVLTLIVPWNPRLLEENAIITLISLSIVLNLYTVLEMLLKLLAFGPAYFQSWRNLFDFILSFATVVYAICGLIALTKTSNHIEYLQVSYFALGLGILKLLTIMVKYSSMLNLLITVLNTVFRSFSLLTVLVVISLTYAMLGVAFFGNVRTGEAFDLRLVNFSFSIRSLSAVWRAFTGEDWYQLMWDAAVQPPYCDNEVLKNCGNPYIAVLYFASFTFVVPFILLNVFIAVLLENFSIFYNDEETNLDLVVMKDFKRKWRMIDLNAKGHIPIRRVKLLLRSLDLQSYYTFIPEGYIRERVIHQLTEDSLLLWEMEKELQQEAVLLTGTGVDEDIDEVSVQFLNVLRMLAYRCEDIHRRLEPQELFTRRELEQNVQLDVAEKCILQWLKKKSKSFIERQQKERELLRNAGHEQTKTTVSINNKRQQLLALHKAAASQTQFLEVHGWKQQETEDDDDSAETRRRSWSQMNANSEERIDQYDGCNVSQNELSTRSFNKIMENSSSRRSSINQERTQEWYKIQEEWMDKVKTDDSYFDDRL